MTKTTTQFAALALSALMNGIATKQYAVADTLAMAAYGQTQVAAVQRVTIVGHRANA